MYVNMSVWLKLYSIEFLKVEQPHPDSANKGWITSACVHQTTTFVVIFVKFYDGEKLSWVLL